MSAVSERETSRGVWRGSLLASSSGRVNLLLFVLSLAIGTTSESSLIQPHLLQKRSVVQFCDLINRFTGRPCSDYRYYGCYCGLGNALGDLVDAVDRCCQAHHCCWDHSSCTQLPLLVTYDITCTGTSCSCNDSPVTDPCNYNVCRCDLIFAQCLRSAQYNPQYKDYCPR